MRYGAFAKFWAPLPNLPEWYKVPINSCHVPTVAGLPVPNELKKTSPRVLLLTPTSVDSPETEDLIQVSKTTLLS